MGGRSGSPAVAEPRRVMIFTVVSLVLLMYAMDQTIVATALPTLRRDLHTSINWTSWTITIYSVGQVLVLPLMGRVSDRYGRRRVFVSSIAVFAAASLACGLAGNIYILIAMRVWRRSGVLASPRRLPESSSTTSVTPAIARWGCSEASFRSGR